MTSQGAIELEFISTTVSVNRPIDGGADVFRQLFVDVEYDDISIGSLWAWMGWDISEEDVFDVADAISYDAGVLGAAASQIISAKADLWIEHVLLIDRIYLEPEHRGNRLTKRIVDDLLALLRLDPDQTLVVLYPEPQQAKGGPMPDGPARDAAMKRLRRAYKASGFRPWRRSGVWWLPIEGEA